MAYPVQIYTSPPIPPRLANARTFQDLREGSKEYLSLLGKYHYDQFNTLIRGHNQNTQGLGDQIASADTIRITQPMHVITGTGTINTIIPPKGFNAMLMLFADNETNGFHLGPNGNIWIDAPTPVQNYTIMCYTPKPPPSWGPPPTGPGGWWVTNNYYGGNNITITGRQGIHTSGPYTPTSFPLGALLYGDGTAAIQALLDVAAGHYVRSGGLLTPPRYSTLTLPDTTVIGDVLVATANNQVGNIGPLTNGDLVIGSTGAAPAAAPLTPGAGIKTNVGAGFLAVRATGGTMVVKPVPNALSPYPVVADDVLLWAAATAGADTEVDLPAAAGPDANGNSRVVWVGKSDNNAKNINVKPSGTNTINGVNSNWVLGTQFDLVMLVDVAVGAWLAK